LDSNIALGQEITRGKKMMVAIRRSQMRLLHGGKSHSLQ
jgi:hypothetical protein